MTELNNVLYLEHSKIRPLKMHENILTSFNWLDLLMIIVMIGTVFRGAVQGFVIEFFRVLGTVFATIFVLHFYVHSAEALNDFVALPHKVGEILSFILIWVLTILIFKLIREGWFLVLKSEAKSGFSQWLGGFVAIIRSGLICGLLFFLIFLFGNQTLDTFAEKSATGFYLCDLSPQVYRASYDGVISKFFPDEALNKKAFKTINKESVLKK